MKHRPSKHSTARHSSARHSLATPTPAKVKPVKAATPVDTSRPAKALSRRELLAALGAGSVIALSASVVRLRTSKTEVAAAQQSAAGMSYPKDLPQPPPVGGISDQPAPDLPGPEPATDLSPHRTEIADADHGPTRMVMIIRHGEKPAKGTDADDVDGSDAPLGWDPLGNPDKHSLTTRGWTRASGIAGLFAPQHSSLRPGLARPKLIYAAAATDDGDGTRTRETVKALAQRLGVPINTSFGKGDEVALAHHAAGQQVPVLICWQHGEIPAIAAAFSPVSPQPPLDWPDDRFDMVWTLTPVRSSWKFDQVPQMVLDGDSRQAFR